MSIAVLFFAIMNVIIKYLSHYSAIELVFYRALVTLFISGYFIFKKRIALKGNNTKLLLLRGIFGFFGLSLYFITVQKMNLANAVVLQYTSPVFTVLLAMVFLKESIVKLQYFAILICVAGLVMIKQFGFIEPLYFGMGVLSAFFSGAAYNVIRKLKGTESPNLIVFYFPMVTLPIAIGVLLFQKQMIAPTFYEILLLLAMGICTQIAQLTMTMAYQKEIAANIAPISYTGLGYALFFGFLLFNEKPSYLEIAGFLVVICGVLINIYAPKITKWFKING